MAITFKSENIKVVLFVDDAVRCDRDTYETYLENLDESLLELAAEPTRFVMAKSMPYEASVKLRNELFKIEQKEGAKLDKANPMSAYNVQVNSGSQALKEVKYTLIGIENPVGVADALQYEQDKGEPGASKELMSKLIAIGAVEDLHTARANAVGGVADLKK